MWWLTGVIKDQVKTKNDLVHIALLLGLGHLKLLEMIPSVQTLCDPMNCSTPGLPDHHHLPEFTQAHIHVPWM